MFFKNLNLFRLQSPWNITPAELEQKLMEKPLIPCSGQTAMSRGWVPPRDEDGSIVESVLPHMLIAQGIEEKILPASVVNQEAKKKAREFESQRGYKPGRKQMRDIKDEVTMTLLPRAFAQQKMVRAWIDLDQGWLVVDTSTASAAENLVEHLRATVPDMPPVRLIEPNMALSVTLTEWLARNAAPGNFQIEDEGELNGSEETKSIVRYLRHPLNTEEIRKHISAGKRASKLAMSWSDKFSFVLHDTMQIKRLKFIDIDDDNGNDDVDAEQRFEIDFTLMAGELRLMLKELCIAVGDGDLFDESSAAAQDLPRNEPAPHSTTDERDDPLYAEAKSVVTESGKASISWVQRSLNIGYNRAARLVELLESEGVVTAPNDKGQRAVLEAA